MAKPYVAKTRKQLRQSIGYKTGAIIVSEASANGGDTSSLIDTYALARRGGTKDYIGRQVMFVSGNNDGEKSFVSAFDNTNKDATLSPAVSNNILSGDDYEMWEGFTVEQVHSIMNDAIVDASDDILRDKTDSTSLYTQEDIRLFDIPSGFYAIHRVDYEDDTKIDHTIHDCETVWDELVDGDVTATAESNFFGSGVTALKLVVAAGCAAGDILATEDITSLDMSDADQVELWVYSTVALAAGDIQVLLDNTAQCASPLESLDIPAISANTKTKVAITLANPHSDTAIISVGLKMVTDKGAFTLYVAKVHAVHSDSRVWERIPPTEYGIAQGSTPQLQLYEAGYSRVTNNRWLRLSGYQLPSELSADTDSCDINSDYIIYKTAGELLLSQAQRDDRDDSRRRGLDFLSLAEVKKKEARTSFAPNTRYVGR